MVQSIKGPKPHVQFGMSKELSKLLFFAISKVKPELLRHLDTISWLTDQRDEQRRSGRTTVMALAYLNHAAENPGKTIHLMDHCGKEGVEVLRDIILRWITESGSTVSYQCPANAKLVLSDSRGSINQGWVNMSSSDKNSPLRRAMSSLMANGYTYDEIKKALDDVVIAAVHST